MQGEDIEEFETLKMVVTRIYDQCTKTFILVVIDELGANDTQTLSFHLKFYTQYVQLVNTYSNGIHVTLLFKNIENAIFGEQQLVTKFSNVFVIPTFDHAVIDRQPQQSA